MSIQVYSQPGCPFCVKAISLLKYKGVENIEEIDITEREGLKEIMIERSNGSKTTPQIFINGTHVGGYDDLAEIENSGKLDTLLEQKSGS